MVIRITACRDHAYGPVTVSLPGIAGRPDQPRVSASREAIDLTGSEQVIPSQT